MFVLVAQLWSQHPFVFFQSKNDLGLSLNRLLIVSSRPNVKAISSHPLSPNRIYTQTHTSPAQYKLLTRDLELAYFAGVRPDQA
jgi:hypothetical protein